MRKGVYDLIGIANSAQSTRVKYVEHRARKVGCVLCAYRVRERYWFTNQKTNASQGLVTNQDCVFAMCKV